MVHVVVLNRQPQRQMQEFVDALHAATDFFRMISPDVWVAATRMNSGQLYTALSPTVRRQDGLFIARITKDNYGQLDRDVWDWLSAADRTDWF